MPHAHSHDDHDHAGDAGRAHERALAWSLLLTGIFVVAEVVGGLLTGSLALLSDAAHMFTDSFALAISLAAIRLGRRPADRRRTFGYARIEILAAALNAVLLFAVALYILWEAWRRIAAPAEVQSTAMLVVAVLGLAVNLASMRLLRAGKDSSLNVKAAYLEVWSDMLGSVGVIVGALVIRYTGWTWVDSLVAVAIGLVVLPRTWRMLSESANLLLEGVPRDIDLGAVEAMLRATPGVASLHDLHVWALSSGKPSLSVHVVCDGRVDEGDALLRALRAALADRFGIHHSTVQIEREPCEQADEDHRFGPADVGGFGHDHAH